MKRVIVFDFDGVIVPSEEIKVQGYSLIFSEFGEYVPIEAIEEARKEFAEGKGNRFDIIRSIFQRIGSKDVDAHTEEYVMRYGKIVKERIGALEVNPDIRKILGQLHSHYPLYINSNNPDQSLKDTLRSLNIESYFKGVFGSLKKKVQNLQGIARLENARPEDILFIGDGDGDFSATEEFGCEFIGIANEVNGWKVSEKSFRLISSLNQLSIEHGEQPLAKLI